MKQPLIVATTLQSYRNSLFLPTLLKEQNPSQNSPNFFRNLLLDSKKKINFAAEMVILKGKRTLIKDEKGNKVRILDSTRCCKSH